MNRRALLILFLFAFSPQISKLVDIRACECFVRARLFKKNKNIHYLFFKTKGSNLGSSIVAEL